MINYKKNEIFAKIKLLSNDSQRYLCNLLCHKFYNFPIEYNETTEIIELLSCNLIYKATQREHFIELSISELENCLSYLGTTLDCELNKEMLIDEIMIYSEKINNNFIPVINFNLQRAVFKFLCKKFNLEFE